MARAAGRSPSMTSRNARRSTCRPSTTRHTVKGVARTRPTGPQSAVQNVADATTADGRQAGAVPVQQRFHHVAHQRLDHQKKSRRPQQHRPAGVHRSRERQRKHRRDDGADIRHEAENRGQDAPKHWTGDSDHPQASADHDTKGGIQSELDEKKPAQARCRIVQRSGRFLQIMRTRQLDETITQILPLQKNEDDEYCDDAGCRERPEQGRNQRCNALQGSGRRLTDLDRYRFGLLPGSGSGANWW